MTAPSQGPDVTDGAAAEPAARRRISADPESVERGLVTLVLTLVELLRQLMERQALRRVEDGTLADDKVEEIGQTLLALDERMSELTEQFGLTREDLNLDLGPLGPLLPQELLRFAPGSPGSGHQPSSRFSHPDALGMRDVRARAEAAGWRRDAVGRLACPRCQQANAAFRATHPVVPWSPLHGRSAAGGRP
jgi:hypothetical protein